MLVAIKKYEFFTKKTDFVGFIIKLGKISIDLITERGQWLQSVCIQGVYKTLRDQS